MYTPIDISNWNRRELFQHFSQMKMPHFIVAANADVTRLLAYKRANGLSFYLSLIYLSTEVLNSIDNFHLCFEQGQVVSYDRIHTNFTHKRAGEDVFRYHTAPFEGTLQEYVTATSQAIIRQTTLFGGLGAIPNVAYFSCVPMLDATMIGNPGMENPQDAIPRINWGGYVERDGRWLLNISVTVNHCFLDGYHVGLFFQRLQERINNLP